MISNACMKLISAIDMYLPFIGLMARHIFWKILPSPVAQSVEQVAVNHLVGGSSPSRGAIFVS
jgi:hypothetical protein